MRPTTVYLKQETFDTLLKFAEDSKMPISHLLREVLEDFAAPPSCDCLGSGCAKCGGQG
jgi:predicted DNA-binding ribbon-helix-helix protein